LKEKKSRALFFILQLTITVRVCILGLMKEWFGFGPRGMLILKEAEFTPGIGSISKIVLNIIERANSVGDKGIRERLLYYAGLPNGSDNEFELAESGVEKKSVEVFTMVDGEKKIAFILGQGNTSVFFENKDAVKDRMIYKSKKFEEIRNFDDLAQTIHGFIRLEPKEGEIIDISKEALDEKMKRHTGHVPVTLTFTNFGNKKKIGGFSK